MIGYRERPPPRDRDPFRVRIPSAIRRRPLYYCITTTAAKRIGQLACEGALRQEIEIISPGKCRPRSLCGTLSTNFQHLSTCEQRPVLHHVAPCSSPISSTAARQPAVGDRTHYLARNDPYRGSPQISVYAMKWVSNRGIAENRPIRHQIKALCHEKTWNGTWDRAFATTRFGKLSRPGHARLRERASARALFQRDEFCENDGIGLRTDRLAIRMGSRREAPRTSFPRRPRNVTPGLR